MAQRPTADGEQLLVARIGKPHGLGGEVTVQLHTDDPQRRFADGAVLTTQAPAGSGVPRELVIRGTRVHRGIWLVAFDGIPDRTRAESLRGTRLFVDAGDGLPEDDDEGWYEDELVGLAAVTVTGEEVGTVTALQTGAAQDLLVVRLAAGGEALVPFVESIVPVVDVPGHRVVLDPPPGLLELAAD